MTPQQLDHLASRHAVLVSTVLYLPHPKDGYEAWRRKWHKVTDLVDEITRMARLADRRMTRLWAPLPRPLIDRQRNQAR